MLTDLAKNSASGSELEFLASLSKLEDLTLGTDLALSQQTLASLSNSPALKKLVIECDAPLSDSAITGLSKFASLKSLRLNCGSVANNNKFSDTYATSPTYLDATPTTDAGFVPLTNLTNLFRLEIPLSPQNTDAVVQHFAAMKSLRRLRIHINDAFTGNTLSQLKDLDYLELDGTLRTTAAKRLQLQLPENVQELVIGHMETLTDADLAAIAKLPKLKSLRIANCLNITDAGVAQLQQLPQLKALDIMACDRVTFAAATALQAAKPDLKIGGFY